MKTNIFIYCEGSDTKIAVVSRENGTIKVRRIITFDTAQGTSGDNITDFDLGELSGDFNFDKGDSEAGESIPNTEAERLAAALEGINLNQAKFISVGTEPSITYHVYEGPKQKDRKSQLQAIISDIERAKSTYVAPDSIDYIDFDENSLLAAFIENNVPCLELINTLAEKVGKRFLKIESIKSADIALAYYVSKSVKFFPEDYTLIIYTGKEYSKLIFLQGNKLIHIGSTLDIGTKNLNTYDVYFSKILLEMENGNIPQLDNVILCGEDRSENLVLSFYGTFPEANVSELEFKDFDVSDLNEEDKKKFPDFSIPLSAAVEFFDEADKKHKGINILPKYIAESQKMFQFSWHSIAVLPLIFLAAFFFTHEYLSNRQQINELDAEIARLEQLQRQNQEIMDQIYPLSEKIAGFDVTKTILDSATVGTEVWGETLNNMADFIERRRNFWITKIEASASDELRINGYSVSRSVLTEFADFYNTSLLKNIIYEPLRDRNAFSFEMTFRLPENVDRLNGP